MTWEELLERSEKQTDNLLKMSEELLEEVSILNMALDILSGLECEDIECSFCGKYPMCKICKKEWSILKAKEEIENDTKRSTTCSDV